MAKKSSERILKGSNPNRPENLAAKIAVVEVQVDRIELELSKLIDTVDTLKNNHLHHIALDLVEIKAALFNTKANELEIKQINEKLAEQKLTIERVNDLRKWFIGGLATVLAAYVPTLCEMIWKLSHTH